MSPVKQPVTLSPAPVTPDYRDSAAGCATLAQMEVRAMKLGGCLMVILGVFTLGVAPLGIWWSMRRWPAWVDNQGVRLKSGVTIGWPQITRVVKVVSDVNGTITTRYDLQSALGVVRVVPDRLENGEQVLEFILQRVPPNALNS